MVHQAASDGGGNLTQTEDEDSDPFAIIDEIRAAFEDLAAEAIEREAAKAVAKALAELTAECDRVASLHECPERFRPPTSH